jgi:hypothetical protein
LPILKFRPQRKGGCFIGTIQPHQAVKFLRCNGKRWQFLAFKDHSRNKGATAQPIHWPDGGWHLDPLTFDLIAKTIAKTNATMMPVLLNEVLAHNLTLTNQSQIPSDWIELYNPASVGIDMAAGTS